MQHAVGRSYATQHAERIQRSLRTPGGLAAPHHTSAVIDISAAACTRMPSLPLSSTSLSPEVLLAHAHRAGPLVTAPEGLAASPSAAAALGSAPRARADRRVGASSSGGGAARRLGGWREWAPASGSLGRAAARTLAAAAATPSACSCSRLRWMRNSRCAPADCREAAAVGCCQTAEIRDPSWRVGKCTAIMATQGLAAGERSCPVRAVSCMAAPSYGD